MIFCLYLGCSPVANKPASPGKDTAIIEPNNQPRLTPAKLKSPEPLTITFADLDLPFDGESLYQEWMLSQNQRDLLESKVKIRGYMSESLFQLKDIKEFVLMRDKDCCFFGPGATPDHLIQVELADKLTTHFTPREIEIEGVLSVAPYTGTDAKTWTVFKIEATHIERYFSAE